MLFRQYDLECLSLFSYLIGDETTGRAVVVDPQRDVTQYLADAEEAGLRIERVIETHFHADFLSGHLELAAATGAAIAYGPGAEPDFAAEELSDGDRLVLGEVVVEVRATPGHTPESISLVVYEHASDEVPYGVLTGDALFIGDVGRPDLLAAGGLSAEQMAADLYASLWGKLLSLPDETRVFPAHGAGSSCGKSLSEATSSTIGAERAANPSLAFADAPSFVAALTAGQPAPPRYFPFTADTNRRERPLLDESEQMASLRLEQVLGLLEQGAVVLDTRHPSSFAARHLTGSVNVGLDGRFAEYAGSALEPGEAIVVVADDGREGEARLRLGRIGYDTVLGYLADIAGLLASRPDLATSSERLGPADLLAKMAAVQLVDVRGPGETEGGVIEGARPVPLPTLIDRLGELDGERETVVYCASGFRSSIAASLLRRAGFGAVSDLEGGFDAWAAAGLPAVAPAAPGS